MASDVLIAIVDDDASALEAATSLVEALGFEALGFPDAATFLGSGTLGRAKCLISDVRMPGMSGVELYLHIAAGGHALPTILTTAYPDETTRLRALRAGVQCYLAKPFDPDELMTCLLEAVAAG